MILYAEESAKFGVVVASWLKILYTYVLVKIEEARSLRRIRQRTSLISRALDTPEARENLAQAMVEPIRRSLDYQSIGRSLLMVDELPTGAYATYADEIQQVQQEAMNRTGIRTEPETCSICGSRRGRCSHFRRRDGERDERRETFTCSNCGMVVVHNAYSEFQTEGLCTGCYRNRNFNRTTSELQQLELDRLRIEMARLSSTPSITIPISNNCSEVTSGDLNDAVCTSLWCSEIHVSNMMGSVLAEADRVNNSVSEILSEDFDAELDRDTYGADR